ncbi:gag-pol polyprotein [Tanacetum coccineum]
MILLAHAIAKRFSNPTKNHLRTSSNTRNNVQGDRVNIQSKNSGNDGRNIRRSYVQEEIIEGNNVQNDAGNIQRTLRTTSLGTATNVQCYNCSEKGHYARNFPKSRVRDSKDLSRGLSEIEEHQQSGNEDKSKGSDLKTCQLFGNFTEFFPRMAELYNESDKWNLETIWYLVKDEHKRPQSAIFMPMREVDPLDKLARMYLKEKVWGSEFRYEYCMSYWKLTWTKLALSMLAPLEALYGRKIVVHLFAGAEVGQVQLTGPEFVQETTENHSNQRNGCKAACVESNSRAYALKATTKWIEYLHFVEERLKSWITMKSIQLKTKLDGPNCQGSRCESRRGPEFTWEKREDQLDFSDADPHPGCLVHATDTSGGIQFLGDRLVSWMSKKQDFTAMSSAKAEYVALSASCAQVMWMRTQLEDYGFNYNKIPLYCESQSGRTGLVLERGIIELALCPELEYNWLDPVLLKPFPNKGFSISSDELV